MNAYELYEAVFDNDAEETVEYIKQYAEGAFDLSISEEVAQKILDCRERYKAETERNGEGQNNLYHFVKAPLSEILLS